MNSNQERKLLLIIDEQRGFMPASEGERLGQQGFGELPVPEGEQTVAPINRLIENARKMGYLIATTQDWHPHVTAHFAPEGEEPNFTTNWPRHCVAGSLGAELHPGLKNLETRSRFTKGFEPLEDGADDTSYSAYYAEEPTSGLSLPEWIKKHNVTKVLLGGLALDYCLGKSAIDLREKMNLEVTVALDTTRPVAPESGQAMLKELDKLGVKFSDTFDIVDNERDPWDEARLDTNGTVKPTRII